MWCLALEYWGIWLGKGFFVGGDMVLCVSLALFGINAKEGRVIFINDYVGVLY